MCHLSNALLLMDALINNTDLPQWLTGLLASAQRTGDSSQEEEENEEGEGEGEAKVVERDEEVSNQAVSADDDESSTAFSDKENIVVVNVGLRW